MGGAIVAEFVEEVMWLGRYNIQLYVQGFTLSKRGEPPFVNNVDLTPYMDAPFCQTLNRLWL